MGDSDQNSAGGVLAHRAYANLQSGPSDTHAFARFCNRTQRCVDVFWIDFNGRHIRYATLKPGLWLDVDTYVSHPWIFRDHATGQPLPLLPSGSLVYFPASPRPDPPHYTRRVVVIGIPVLSLQEQCIQALRPIYERFTPAEVDKLEIPATLLSDLKDAITSSIRYRFAVQQVPAAAGDSGN